jgi:hypothetical protein
LFRFALQASPLQILLKVISYYFAELKISESIALQLAYPGGPKKGYEVFSYIVNTCGLYSRIMKILLSSDKQFIFKEILFA